MQKIEVRVKGEINEDWSGWLGDLAINHPGDGDTVLNGPVRDQAALYGLLNSLSGLGLELISVHILDALRKTTEEGEKM